MTLRSSLLLAFAALFLFQSCGSGRLKTLALKSSEDYYSFLPPLNNGAEVSGSGRAKIEFENYRFRGKFRFSLEGENLRVDFIHSSLFGAVHAEGSFFVSPEGMALLDEGEGKLYGNDSCEKLTGRITGAAITPDDIFIGLRFKNPDYTEVDSLYAGVGEGEWRMNGIYGRRRFLLEGNRRGEVRSINISGMDGSWSFDVNYGYGDFNRYPDRIVISGRYKPVRIVLDVENFSSGLKNNE